MENTKLVSLLNNLIGVCKDGQQGFLNAAEHAKSPQLKAMLSAYSGRCASGASELEPFVVRHGGEAKQDGTISGAMRRGLTSAKAAISSDSDHAILEECEKGEDVAKKMYADALMEDLPADVRDVLTRQNMEVLQHHDKVRDLRDSKVMA